MKLPRSSDSENKPQNVIVKEAPGMSAACENVTGGFTCMEKAYFISLLFLFYSIYYYFSPVFLA